MSSYRGKMKERVFSVYGSIGTGYDVNVTNHRVIGSERVVDVQDATTGVIVLEVPERKVE